MTKSSPPRVRRSAPRHPTGESAAKATARAATRSTKAPPKLAAPKLAASKLAASKATTPKATPKATATKARVPAPTSVERAHARVDVSAMPSERPGAPGGKRDRNRRERTQLVGQTALALFLARGIEAVTIDDICGAADVAKGSFYRYFRDKEALVVALVAPVDQALREAFDACELRLRQAEDDTSLDAAYQSLALSLWPVAMGHLDVFRLLLQERSGPPIGARGPVTELGRVIDEGAVRLTRVAVDRGLLAIDDPRISAYAVVGAIESLARTVLSGRLDASPVDILTSLIHLVLDGVRARPKKRKS